MSTADLKALQKDTAYNRNLEIIFMVVGAILLIAPMFAGPYARIIGRSVITYMILAVSWDMLVRSGQLSFGIAGFFGLGGYAATVLAANYNIPGVLAIILGAVLSGVVAYGLGMIILRLRGMYFAITTLALAEIFRIIMHNWTPVTGGPNGKLVPQVLFAGNSYLQYGFMIVMAVLVIALSEYFRRSKIHYALTAIHDNEVVAKSNGINIYKNLLFIFAVVSAIQAMVGGGYAHLFGFVSPESNFNANYTLIPLAIALFGGMYSTWGPVVGAVILGVVGEFLKLYIPYGHLVVYGIIIILVLLFMPQGVVGIFKAKLFKNTSNYPSKEELELANTKGEPA